MNTNTLLPYIISIINIDWDNIIDPIGRMFTGGNYTAPITGNITEVTGMFQGDHMIFGVFIFIAFLILTLMFGLGLLIGTVILIPVSFIVFKYIPDLRIIIAILAGLIFGLALHKLIRR